MDNFQNGVMYQVEYPMQHSVLGLTAYINDLSFLIKTKVLLFADARADLGEGAEAPLSKLLP